MSEKNKLVQVYAGTHPEAGYLKTVLEGEGIQVFLFDEMMGTIAAPYIAPGGVGAVRVMIATSDVERAEPLIEDFRRGGKRDRDDGKDSI